MKKTLFRHRSDKMIGGVAGGIAAFLEQDPTIVRVVLALMVLVANGGVVLAYLVAWALMPEGPADEDGALGPSYLDKWSNRQGPAPQPPGAAATSGFPSAPDPPGGTIPQAPPVAPAAPSSVISEPAQGARWLGFALIAVGVVALVERYVPRFDLWELWPVAIIIVGAVTVFGRRRG